MATKPKHTDSSEIGTVTLDIKELQKNPILVPILDYLKGSQIFEKEDKRESENLKTISDELKKLQDTGIYEDSRIAIKYEEAVGLWERIAWIYQKNVSLANNQITQIKKTVEKFYVTKVELENQISLLEDELEKEKAKSKELAKPKEIEKEIETTIQDKKEMAEEELSEKEILEKQING